uniref:Acetyltransf_18 domain-containing protein n=1 Tax=Syphacia muris TaxID=451379 RepID=A0A0N5AW18_9BILA
MVRCSLSAYSYALAKKTNCEKLLSESPESTSAYLEDSDGNMRALVSMVKYSPTQAYCTIAEQDHTLKGKYICVKETENPCCLKITATKDTPENTRFLPVYVQVHHNPKSRLPLEHLIDQLSKSVLGQLNLDLKKNVTVDLLDDDNLDIWRDKAAFFVTDQQHLCELTAYVPEFLQTLRYDNDDGISITRLNELNKNDVFNYDQKVSGINRVAFLEKLFQQSTIYVAEDEKEGYIEGYLVAKGDRVLALYANTESSAHMLMEKFLNSHSFKKVTICTRQRCWQVERSPGTQLQRIYRRHTRYVPTNINWNKVYALNVGLHIL